MAETTAKYQFISWARRGISALISDADNLGTDAGDVKIRPSIPVSIGINNDGSPASMSVDLVGPRDIIGINADMIVRTYPTRGTTSQDPNNLALVEFYDEDFLWRYTPAHAVAPTASSTKGEKLRPWLVLLVLKESEFTLNNQGHPLPSIKISTNTALPPFNETWLWAHMHVAEYVAHTELTDFLDSLNKDIPTDPDGVYCRLLCPRKLEAATNYYAFIVPAFEAGRLAGLGQLEDTETQDQKPVPTQQPSWDASTTGIEMPFYYQWDFVTGANEDFESLLALLEPRVLPVEVGIRAMDCTAPGFKQIDASGAVLPLPVSSTSPGILGLEGALKTHDTTSTVFPDPATTVDFQKQVQQLVNFPTQANKNLAEDPIVSIPFYGQSYALKANSNAVLMDFTKDNWYDELNRDPRLRAAAGFGTRVIQTNKDKFMEQAWEQVNTVLAANRAINNHKFVMAYSQQMATKHFNSLPDELLLTVTSALHGKILQSNTTIEYQKTGSTLPKAAFMPMFRKMLSANSDVVKKIGGAQVINLSKMIVNVATNKITAADLRKTLVGLPILQTEVVVSAPPALKAAATQKAQDLKSFNDPKTGLAAIATAPPQPTFSVKFSSDSPAAVEVSQPGLPDKDSIEAALFRTAITDLYQRMAIDLPVSTAPVTFDVKGSSSVIKQYIAPEISFIKRLNAAVRLPSGKIFSRPEEILPVMAYPDFPNPVYAYLRDINKELLIPNLGLIPGNTISILVTNNKFIEAFMLGINQEMGRLLLWNEYPCDMRGSYFRQFWDVTSFIKPDSPSSAEALKDITQIHTWLSASGLGIHNNRAVKEGEVVLVVRGDLLKKYPNTVIYAQKAIADPNDKNNKSGIIQTSNIDDTTFQTQFKFPIFSAGIDPDLRFFGFDLTEEEAVGTTPSGTPPDSLGWYFIIQEVPGDPKFGLDVEFIADTASDSKDPMPPVTWSNESWQNFQSIPAFLTAGGVPPTNISMITDAAAHQWGSNAAEMAYILCRSPLMVAVHASEMLPKKGVAGNGK